MEVDGWSSQRGRQTPQPYISKSSENRSQLPRHRSTSHSHTSHTLPHTSRFSSHIFSSSLPTARANHSAQPLRQHFSCTNLSMFSVHGLSFSPVRWWCAEDVSMSDVYTRMCYFRIGCALGGAALGE